MLQSSFWRGVVASAEPLACVGVRGVGGDGLSAESELSNADEVIPLILPLRACVFSALEKDVRGVDLDKLDDRVLEICFLWGTWTHGERELSFA